MWREWQFETRILVMIYGRNEIEDDEGNLSDVKTQYIDVMVSCSVFQIACDDIYLVTFTNLVYKYYDISIEIVEINQNALRDTGMIEFQEYQSATRLDYIDFDLYLKSQLLNKKIYGGFMFTFYVINLKEFDANPSGFTNLYVLIVAIYTYPSIEQTKNGKQNSVNYLIRAREIQ
ncbi:UNKNOWN [Stylonychia lemnae]|uniref:Uncharacterized protein n=1 Tax=Stylonychia lemnae TaxID=5949 RepID=A0A078AHV7_STYLE|nr:UNKNOWN [Stylonychia lemnae]|eukprot:CDW81092.1 UNKNOWN [Stylonychia lemnae]